MNSILRRAVPTALLAGGVLMAGGGVAAGQVPIGGAEGLGLDELTDVGDLGVRDLGAGNLGALSDLESSNVGGLDDLGLGGGSGGSSGLGLGSGGAGGGGALDSLCSGPLSIVGSVGGGLCDESSGSSAVTGLSATTSSDPSPSYDGKQKPSFDTPSKKGVTVGTLPPHELPTPLAVVCTEPYMTVKNVRSFCDLHTASLRDLPAKGDHDKVVPDDRFDKDDKDDTVVPDDKKKTYPRW